MVPQKDIGRAGQIECHMKQAKPLFLTKWVRVLDRIMDLRVASSSATQAYLYAWDFASLKILYFSGDRTVWQDSTRCRVKYVCSQEVFRCAA